MSKNRRKKSHPRTNQPATVHRYSAEAENKKDARKKFKLRSIAAAVVLGLLLLLGLIFL